MKAGSSSMRVDLMTLQALTLWYEVSKRAYWNNAVFRRRVGSVL